MTLPVMLIMVVIFQLLIVFWEHKRPRSVTGFKISWAIIIQMSLSVVALSEFFIFGTFYSSYLLASALFLAMMNFIGHFIKYSHFLWKSKFDTNFNKNTTDVLFYLNFKIQQLCSINKVSNTFFYKNDGLIVFFGEPETTFSAMHRDALQFFKESVKHSACHLRFGGFVIIKDKENYISLSSDEIKMLEIPVTNINQDYLSLIQMNRI